TSKNSLKTNSAKSAAAKSRQICSRYLRNNEAFSKNASHETCAHPACRSLYLCNLYICPHVRETLSFQLKPQTPFGLLLAPHHGFGQVEQLFRRAMPKPSIVPWGTPIARCSLAAPAGLVKLCC